MKVVKPVHSSSLAPGMLENQVLHFYSSLLQPLLPAITHHTTAPTSDQKKQGAGARCLSKVCADEVREEIKIFQSQFQMEFTTAFSKSGLIIPVPYFSRFKPL